MSKSKCVLESEIESLRRKNKYANDNINFIRRKSTAKAPPSDFLLRGNYIEEIESTYTYRGKEVFFQYGQIGGVDSKDHVILQGLDIVLGSIFFRLNDQHKVKLENSRFRGKRTIAKEKVYREINRQIRNIYPNFNISKSTGQANGVSDRWSHHYRHWCFESSNSVRNELAVKGRSHADT